MNLQEPIYIYYEKKDIVPIIELLVSDIGGYFFPMTIIDDMVIWLRDRSNKITNIDEIRSYIRSIKIYVNDNLEKEFMEGLISGFRFYPNP